MYAINIFILLFVILSLPVKQTRKVHINEENTSVKLKILLKKTINIRTFVRVSTRT